MAMVVLWAITAYLIQEKKAYWVSLVPAIFMTMVCSTYILIAPEGFQLEHNLAYILGAIITIVLGFLFRRFVIKTNRSLIVEKLS